MPRIVIAIIVLFHMISCGKDNTNQPPPPPIPATLTGIITEFQLAPVDLNTPGAGSFLILAENTLYKVDFNAASVTASNALIFIENDTILTDQSREFANLGPETVSYNPVKENEVTLSFNDGRKVEAVFTLNTSFGGTFGADVINQWRTPGDPTKPTQKAKDDLINLVRRYRDKDGPGPDITPQHLVATISRY